MWEVRFKELSWRKSPITFEVSSSLANLHTINLALLHSQAAELA